MSSCKGKSVDTAGITEVDKNKIYRIFCVSEGQTDLQLLSSGRRRTCALLNSPSPCVNSVIQHIQEMKTTVENWCQQVN